MLLGWFSWHAALHQPLLFIDEHTKVLVQGLGKQGQFHSTLMREYGTKVVGGIHAQKAGSTITGLKVYGTVADCVAKTGANASLIFVPAPAAMIEAAKAGVGLIV
jgi:succinyl-CoA synthetase alpha subunit